MTLFIDWLRKKHHYDRYKIVKGLIKGKGKKLLDVGCGSPASCMQEGAFLRYIGFGQGIDIEPRKIPFPFMLGDIMKNPHRDKSFDVVTAIEVIEHIDNPKKALKEIHRILRDKGTFVMTTPNNNAIFTAFWFIWERTFGNEWHHTHLTTYSKRQWLDMIKKTKLFKIKKVMDYWHVNTIVQMEKID